MSIAEYNPGPAAGAHIDKDGDNWTLVLVRELRHSPEKVWSALTDPDQLKEWSPYDSDKNLGTAGTVATITTFGAPGGAPAETTVTRAEPPHALEFMWGHFNTRWKLEPMGQGTRLTLWINIDKPYISMGAAGMHVCLDVLERLLDGDPLGRMAGPALMQNPNWQRLHKEYATLLDVAMPKW